MTIQQQRQISIASTPSWGAMLATLFFASALPSIALLLFVKTQFVLPLLSLTSLGSAGLFALVAWQAPLNPKCTGITLWDTSATYAFIGFAAGMLSEPEQVIELLALPMNATTR